MHHDRSKAHLPGQGRAGTFGGPGGQLHGLGDLASAFRAGASLDAEHTAGAATRTGQGSTGMVRRPDQAPRRSYGHPTGASSSTSHASQYRRGVFVTDLVVIVTVVAVGSLVPALRFGMAPRLGEAALLVVLWMVVLEAFRTRTPRRMAVGADEYKRIVGATAATAGIVGVAVLILGAGPEPDVRSHLLVTFPLGLVGLMLGRWGWRTRLHHLRARGLALSDVVVVGQPADVAYVIRQIARRSAVAYRVVGVVLDQADAPQTGDDLGPGAAPDAGPSAGPGSESLPRTHGTENVPDVVRRLGADAVIVAGPLHGGNTAIRTLGWALEPSHTELILVSSLINVAGPRITMRPMEGLPLMHVEQPQFEGGRHVFKRALDLVVSSVALVLMLPLFGVIAILIRRDSEGGVFFSQIRTGRDGEPFRMYKFRTMVATAEQDKAALAAQNEGAGPLFKMAHDPRVTKVGAFLRRHSLDELPQFWNVLRGDMSLVGPRPPLPEEVATYEGHTGRRLYIKPGLTGLWQISGRSNLDWEESVRLDLYYVENWSVTGDLMIMWRTFKVMVNPEGAF